MSHKIQSATMLSNTIIQAKFMGGEIVQYDVRNLFPILPQFEILLHDTFLAFNLHTDVGGYGVSWNDDLDLDAETIWEDGTMICIEAIDIAQSVAASLTRARAYAHLTQKQLSEKTGIYQSDISKIERGNANPSLSTLKRLASAMNMQLKIEFIPISPNDPK